MSHGTSRGTDGGILVRTETLDGIVRWRSLKSLSHVALCEAAGLYPGTTSFDVPKSFLGGSGRGNRKIEGVILQDRGKGPQPIGKITLVEERERFRDEDHVAALRALGCEIQHA